MKKLFFTLFFGFCIFPFNGMAISDAEPTDPYYVKDPAGCPHGINLQQCNSVVSQPGWQQVRSIPGRPRTIPLRPNDFEELGRTVLLDPNLFPGADVSNIVLGIFLSPRAGTDGICRCVNKFMAYSGPAKQLYPVSFVCNYMNGMVGQGYFFQGMGGNGLHDDVQYFSSVDNHFFGAAINNLGGSDPADIRSCAKCPDLDGIPGQTYQGDNRTGGKCFQEENIAHKDNTGTYIFTEKCHWSY